MEMWNESSGVPRSKKEVEDFFSRKFTDKEYEIILEEVEGRDEDEESIDFVLKDVVNNLESYVAEHDWWNAQVKENKRAE